MRVHVAGNTTTTVEMRNPIIIREVPDPYEGATVVTPSPDTQVLATSGKTVLGDITVNPIPSNYGLITWDGSVLTVS